jgi:hypothetical protein
MESQTMTRLLPGEGELTAIQTLEERTRERAESGVEELAPMGALGRELNPGWLE